MRQEPDCADYQAELAYFYLLIDEPIEARRALDKALMADPQHARALEIWMGMEELEQMSEDDHWLSEIEAFSSLRAPAEDSDAAFDAFYDTVEGFIQQQVRALLQNSVSLDVTQDPEILQQQLQLLKELDFIQPRIEDKLALIEREFDTTELRQQLRPFE